MRFPANGGRQDGKEPNAHYGRLTRFLAKVGEALGQAGVNIDGVCGVTFEGKGLIHVLVEDAVKARQVLQANHIEVSGARKVLVLSVEDRPGVLGNIARRLATANINVNLAHLNASTRLVLGVDDLEKARCLIQQR